MRVRLSQIACIFQVLLLCCIATSELQAQAAKVSQVTTFKTSGEVTTPQTAEPSSNTSSASKTTRTTATASAGGTLATGAEAATSLLLGDLGTARMHADSQVKLPADGNRAHSLELLKGSLYLKIDAAELQKHGPSEFKLKTPTALLAVKGTQFFATSTPDGQELFGVHEGRVVVENAADHKQVELSDGNVVAITNGALGEMRAMTSDELSARKEYDLSALTHEPVPPHSKWEDLKTRRVSTAQKPVLQPDGNVRFTWPLPETKSLTYLSTQFCYDMSAEEAKGVVALEIRLRATGAAAITFFSETPMRVPPVSLSPQNTGWQTLIITFPGYDDKRPGGFNERLGMQIYPGIRMPGDAMKKTGVLEIGPIQLLKEAL